MNYKECFGCRKKIPLDNKGVYCPECRAKIYKYKDENYSVKKDTKKVHGSSAWRKVRTEALKRSNYMCEVCEIKGEIKEAKEVHHIVKVADGDNSTHYNLDNLVCVCDDCHRKIEGMNRIELIKYLESLQNQ